MAPGSKKRFENPRTEMTAPGHSALNLPLMAVEFKISLAQNIMKVQNALYLL